MTDKSPRAMREPEKRARKAVAAFVPSRALPIRVNPDATQTEQARQIANDMLAPETAAVRIVVASEGKSVVGENLDVPGALAELRRVSEAVNAGDLSHPEAMLMSQAQAMQTLSTRLIERALGQEMFCHFEGFMRLGLRAQSQSRQALETLAVLKQGPAVFARQANVAHGPQQVVNGPASPSPPAGARAIENPPLQLSSPDELCADPSAASRASGADQAMAPVGKEHGAKNA